MRLLKWVKKAIKGKLALVDGPLTYNQDGLATRHNCDFILDEDFVRAYRAADRTGSWGGASVHWRVYVECWAAKIGTRLEGDFVECGVERGSTASAVMEYVDFRALQRRYYLLDTFNGVDPSLLSQDEIARGIQRYSDKHYYDCYDEVCKTFATYPNVNIIRGTVPGTLLQATPEKVAYLSIDMNCAAPEIAAAEHFWPRMSSGAMVVLDDYGWTRHLNQKHAFDEFALRHGITILPLPTGQGLMVKP